MSLSITKNTQELMERLITQAEASAAKAYQLIDALYQRGACDYLAVLDARRSKLDVSDEFAKAETALRVSMVSIYPAFGGGWAVQPTESHAADYNPPDKR
jgi:outer membrane protein TolC